MRRTWIAAATAAEFAHVVVEGAVYFLKQTAAGRAEARGRRRIAKSSAAMSSLLLGAAAKRKRRISLTCGTRIIPWSGKLIQEVASLGYSTL